MKFLLLGLVFGSYLVSGKADVLEKNHLLQTSSQGLQFGANDINQDSQGYSYKNPNPAYELPYPDHSATLQGDPIATQQDTPQPDSTNVQEGFDSMAIFYLPPPTTPVFTQAPTLPPSLPPVTAATLPQTVVSSLVPQSSFTAAPVPSSAQPTFPPTRPETVPPTLPPAPQPQPVIVEPLLATADPMALMPQLPTVQMPQIVSIDTSCAKDSMVVRIRFDQVFNGLIYAKDFYKNLACHYVPFNSGRDSYEFTVHLDTCGTQFVDQFSSGSKAYLESVIVLQNEREIQEFWDTARTLRCLWEGTLEKQVSYSLNVDMLDSQIVSISGDSANILMDVQMGKGPFVPSVNGLVKIGETLTMVVSVEGDPGFDVHVKDCVAHDGNRNNRIQLTDNRGCVLKKKLIGPWQKTRQTSSSTVSIMAYSFFQAFKFPDTPEIFLECNVELCKKQCDICPEDAALFGIRGRIRRRAHNITALADVRLATRIRVVAGDEFGPVSLTSGEL